MNETPAQREETYPLLNDGLALYQAGHYFEAHEVWEHAWSTEVGRSKLVLQVLVQMAAALYKHQSESPLGTAKLLAKAKAKLAEAKSDVSAWFGIDLVDLDRQLGLALAASEAIIQGQSDTSLTAPKLPDVTGPDGVLYLHGFASGPSSSKARLIGGSLRARGYYVAVPDQNEGDFFHLTVTRALELARRHLRDRTLVIGSSFGGYLATLLAASDERVQSMLLMAPAFDLGLRLAERHGEDGLRRWQAEGTADVDHFALGGKQAIGFGFIEDARRYLARPPIRVPTYVLQGLRDDVVDPKMVQAVASANAQWVTLDLVDDDHALAAYTDQAIQAVWQKVEALGLHPDPAPSDVIKVLQRWRT